MAQTQELNNPGQKEKHQNTPLQPLSNRVLIRRLEAEESLKGGILLPDSAKKKQEQAEVIALGNGKKDKEGNLIPFSVKVGDIVLIDKYSGQEVTVNDQEYVIVNNDDLIAVIEK